MRNRGFGRRELLVAMAMLVSVTGCARHASGARPASTTLPAGADLADRFAELERRYDARLGVYVPATGTTAAIEYRADERFAFCSTFKAPLVAAVLHQNPLTHLDKLITYTSDDIRSISPVAQQHVQTGMTIGQLCDAAIRYSDGTAANLLLADLGGPGGGTAAFTGYLRSLGDTVSRLDAGSAGGPNRDKRRQPGVRKHCHSQWCGDASADTEYDPGARARRAHRCTCTSRSIWPSYSLCDGARPSSVAVSSQ